MKILNSNERKKSTKIVWQMLLKMWNNTKFNEDLKIFDFLYSFASYSSWAINIFCTTVFFSEQTWIVSWFGKNWQRFIGGQESGNFEVRWGCNVIGFRSWICQANRKSRYFLRKGFEKKAKKRWIIEKAKWNIKGSRGFDHSRHPERVERGNRTQWVFGWH